MTYGRGAGALPTGSAIVSDIIYCARQVEHARYSEMFNVMKEDDVIKDFESEYYVRLNVHDVPGVLADITAVLKKYSISVQQIKQDKNNDIIPITFVTQKTHEFAMNSAVEEISKLPNIIKVENVIRVEE
jgi:homoserine dehydrogenase